MSYASEMMIESQNRNEAKEACVILTELQSRVGVDSYEFKQIEKAIEKIREFGEKHQPEIQRYK